MSKKLVVERFSYLKQDTKAGVTHPEFSHVLFHIFPILKLFDVLSLFRKRQIFGLRARQDKMCEINIKNYIMRLEAHVLESSLLFISNS
jgi:hypothetical protein